ncbi:MAG: acyltransferase [Lachnospiraceae bacterium]|nr:acyltransferase [Lachnospiraceae bacterium]
MRKYYLDNIRWATVVLVVIYHVFYMYNGTGIQGGLRKITDLDVQYYDAYQYIVFPWFMMVLFIISGIVSRIYLENHTGKEFAKSRTTKLLVPTTIGLIAFQFIQGYFNMALSGAFDTMEGVPGFVRYLIMLASGIGVLWYIQLLWVYSMLLLLIRKIEKDRLWSFCAKVNAPVIILISALVFGSAQVLNTPIISVYRIGLYGLSFLLGYFVFSHDEVIDILKRYFILLLVIALALGTAFVIKYFGSNYADAPVNRTPLFVLYAWSACLAILGGAAKYADFMTPFTKWMSDHSFGLYVFHYLGISVIALYIAKPGLCHPAIVYIISLIAAFAFGYGLYAVISRIPFFRWAVLGIKGNKKKAGNENVQ